MVGPLERRPKIQNGEYHCAMHLAVDYIHPTPRGGRCRVRIFLPEDEQDAPMVICSELPNNEGSSVTYSAHQIAAEVIRYHRLAREGQDRREDAARQAQEGA